jgi:hypothetical protein
LNPRHSRQAFHGGGGLWDNFYLNLAAIVVYTASKSMAIKYEITVNGELLSAKAWGSHDDVEDVTEYGAALVAAGVEAECTKALLDERLLDHDLGEGDVYFLAERYSSSVPKLVRAAILFDQSHAGNIRFWETCAMNRGLSVRVFKSRASALSWLNGNSPP